MIAILNEIIRQNEFSIRSFSKAIGISRSFVQRVLTGDKKITQKMFAAIMNLDEIPEKQKLKLQKIYFDDINTETSIDYIKHFLELNENFDKNCVYTHTPKMNSDLSQKFQTENCISLENTKDILSAIVYSINNSTKKCTPARIFLYYPVFNKDLENTIYTCILKRDYDSGYNIQRIVDLPCDYGNKFLDALFNILKWGYAQTQTKCRLTDDDFSQTNPFPYFVILDDEVIIFNEDVTKGIVLLDADTVKNYINEFEKIADSCLVLDNIYENELELMQNVREKTIFQYALDGFACMGPFLDYDVLDGIAHATLPNREYMIYSVLQHYGMNSYPNGLNIFQTKKSLEKFLLDGDIITFTDKFAHTTPVPMRVRCFENIMKLIDDENVSYKLIDESKFNPSEVLTIELYNDGVCIQLVYNNQSNKGKNKKYCYTIFIDDNLIFGIENSVREIRTYLDSCNYTYSKENTKKYFPSLSAKESI